jgi:hypothetical protein
MERHSFFRIRVSFKAHMDPIKDFVISIYKTTTMRGTKTFINQRHGPVTWCILKSIKKAGFSANQYLPGFSDR